MKRLYVICLVCLVFVSCTKEDSETVDLLAPLVGVWEASSIVTTNCGDMSDDGIFNCDGPCYQLTVRDDFDFSFNNYLEGTSMDGTLRVEATTLQFCDEDDINCNPEVEYTLNDDLLTIVAYWQAKDCDVIAVYNKQ
ncbi:MAG: hypothetical protein RIG77_25505 [Cyclobacteriaceae bacterium]